MPNTSRKNENISTKPKVFVGLSGGVDSAVSAALLTSAGYDVTGVFIRIAISGYPCPATQDRIEAMRVAAHLDIPFAEIDLSKEYEKKVFDISMQEFARGRTPNPDALCNREIKFGTFFEFAKSHGADFVATGHYARVAPQNDSLRVREFSAENSLSPRAVALRSPSQNHSVSLREIHLLASTDENKDQSYFLWAVPQAQLSQTLFPVGGMHKPEVRALAAKFKLPNARRKDSQGLCFLGDISLDDMLAKEVSTTPGNVLSESGGAIGTHKGAAHYTLGQRHGFDLNIATSSEHPHFVIGKDMKANTITVSENKFPKDAKETRLTMVDTNWIGGAAPGEYMARFRYRQTLIKATLVKTSENSAEVVLHEPHYVPLGQSLVLYKEERCLGGGIIDEARIA
jgi:tRNA-specific 2-thiouridylase